MARAIPNTTLGANYTTLFEGDIGYASGFVQIYNGLAQLLLTSGPHQGQSAETVEVPAPPGIFPLQAGTTFGARDGDFIYGLQARQYPGTTLADPTKPIQILGSVFRPGDASIIPASPLTQTLDSNGTIAQPGGSVITGIVNGNGTPAAGTGFTVNRTAPGMYTVTFTTAFSAVPVVLATITQLTSDYVPYVSVTASGFTINLTGGGGGSADWSWNFTAQAVA